MVSEEVFRFFFLKSTSPCCWIGCLRFLDLAKIQERELFKYKPTMLQCYEVLEPLLKREK